MRFSYLRSPLTLFTVQKQIGSKLSVTVTRAKVQWFAHDWAFTCRYYLTRFFQFLRILNCFLFFFLLSVDWFKFAFSKRLTTLASFPGLQGYTLKPWRKSFYTMSPNLWLFSLSSSSPSVVQKLYLSVTPLKTTTLGVYWSLLHEALFYSEKEFLAGILLIGLFKEQCQC